MKKSKDELFAEKVRDLADEFGVGCSLVIFNGKEPNPKSRLLHEVTETQVFASAWSLFFDNDIKTNRLPLLQIMMKQALVVDKGMTPEQVEELLKDKDLS